MSEWWVQQLHAWDDDSVFDRLEKAMESGDTVLVKRSDGSISNATICGLGGFGGRVVSVKIDGDPSRYKAVDTDYFLELNPDLGRSMIELRPEEDRK